MVTNTGEVRSASREDMTVAGGRAANAPGTSRTLRRGRLIDTASAQAARLVRWVVAIVDVTLGLDFLFRFIGARSTGFVHAVYVVGSDLASPFSGIFAGIRESGAYTLTWSDVVAAALVTAAGWILVRILRSPARGRRRV
jgi:hypothetical protein